MTYAMPIRLPATLGWGCGAPNERGRQAVGYSMRRLYLIWIYQK